MLTLDKWLAKVLASNDFLNYDMRAMTVQKEKELMTRTENALDSIRPYYKFAWR